MRFAPQTIPAPAPGLGGAVRGEVICSTKARASPGRAFHAVDLLQKISTYCRFCRRSKKYK